jgi:tetratricopeptide (TPR) repeat protein
LYATKAQWQDAVFCYQAAIAHDPNFAGAYLKLGEAWLALGDQVQSLLSFQKGAQLQPSLLTVAEHLDLAKQLMEQQQWEAAVVQYRLVLQLDQQQLEAWMKLAEGLVHQGNPEAAIAVYRQALTIFPEQVFLYTYLGNLLTRQQQIEEAIALHRRAAGMRGWTQAEVNQYRFTYDWFTHNLPIWQQYLVGYIGQPGVKILEIGSYEGMSSCWFLDQVLTDPTAELHCIDVVYPTFFERNVLVTGVPEKLVKRVGSSHDILPMLAEDYTAAYDVIYIDGCHLAEHVRLDAVLSWQLLKPGGLMIFDDYMWSDANYPDQDPSLGIDEFVTSISAQSELVHRGYQMIIRKTN